MSSELEQIKQVFNNIGIPLSMDWLESCIEWCKNNDLPTNYTLKNLQNMVYEQWLILDLRDVEIRSLPRNLSMEKKFSLTGVYYLQVMQVLDISKPKLWQLQRIRKNVAKNTESNNDFGKRVLQLTLTDGVQEIQAMEFKPIPWLNINLTPGSKIKITGPVMIRNGRMMMEQDNVKVLGGSVDDLLIKYAAENVLARALGLEENPNPHVIDENVLEAKQDNNTVTQQNPVTNFQVSNQNSNPRQVRDNIHIVQSGAVCNKPNINKQIIRNQEIPPEFEVDDELLRELEEDFEENSVKNFKKALNTSRTSTQFNAQKTADSTSIRGCTSPDLFEEMGFDDELLNEHLNQINMECPELKELDNKSSKHAGQNNKNSSSLGDNIKPQSDCEVINLDDSFDDIDIDSHLDHIDEEMAKVPCSTQKITDFKKQVKSPLLKCQTRTPKLTVSQASTSKKLTQSKLTFGNKVINKKLPDTLKKEVVNLYNDDDDDFEDPFNSSIKFTQKRSSGSVPLDDASRVSKKCPSTSKESSSPIKTPTELKCSPGLPKINVLSIEKLKKMLPNISKGKFKIKAKFHAVAEKLKTTATSFYLVITIRDDTGKLTVEMHSDIVARFAQTKPEKLAELRELVVNNDQAAKSVIHQVLKNLHAKCMALDNVLELQITRGDKYPVVVNVIEGS